MSVASLAFGATATTPLPVSQWTQAPPFRRCGPARLRHRVLALPRLGLLFASPTTPPMLALQRASAALAGWAVASHLPMAFKRFGASLAG